MEKIPRLKQHGCATALLEKTRRIEIEESMGLSAPEIGMSPFAGIVQAYLGDRPTVGIAQGERLLPRCEAMTAGLRIGLGKSGREATLLHGGHALHGIDLGYHGEATSTSDKTGLFLLDRHPGKGVIDDKLLEPFDDGSYLYACSSDDARFLAATGPAPQICSDAEIADAISSIVFIATDPKAPAQYALRVPARLLAYDGARFTLCTPFDPIICGRLGLSAKCWGDELPTKQGANSDGTVIWSISAKSGSGRTQRLALDPRNSCLMLKPADRESKCAFLPIAPGTPQRRRLQWPENRSLHDAKLALAWHQQLENLPAPMPPNILETVGTYLGGSARTYGSELFVTMETPRGASRALLYCGDTSIACWTLGFGFNPMQAALLLEPGSAGLVPLEKSRLISAESHTVFLLDKTRESIVGDSSSPLLMGCSYSELERIAEQRGTILLCTSPRFICVPAMLEGVSVIGRGVQLHVETMARLEPLRLAGRWTDLKWTSRGNAPERRLWTVSLEMTHIGRHVCHDPWTRSMSSQKVVK